MIGDFYAGHPVELLNLLAGLSEKEIVELTELARERIERKELKRLKEKYEGTND